MKAWFGFTRTRGSLVGWFIARITGPWHHGLIAFGMETPEVYYEARAGADEGAGFRGPKPYTKLTTWAAQPGHTMEMIEVTPLALRYTGVMAMLRWCDYEATTERRGYDVPQLFRIWAVRRVLKRMGFALANDMTKTICSEAQTRAGIAGGFDLAERMGMTPDAMSPTDVYEAARAALAEQNAALRT